jgi:hypothetical protein
MKKLLVLCLAFCAATSAMSADTTPARSSTPNWQSQTRQLIDAKSFDQAINALLQADEKQSADWHNLMGYSLRKKSPPMMWMRNMSEKLLHTRMSPNLENNSCFASMVTFWM